MELKNQISESITTNNNFNPLFYEFGNEWELPRRKQTPRAYQSEQKRILRSYLDKKSIRNFILKRIFEKDILKIISENPQYYSQFNKRQQEIKAVEVYQERIEAKREKEKAEVEKMLTDRQQFWIDNAERVKEHERFIKEQREAEAKFFQVEKERLDNEASFKNLSEVIVEKEPKKEVDKLKSSLNLGKESSDDINVSEVEKLSKKLSERFSEVERKVNFVDSSEPFRKEEYYSNDEMEQNYSRHSIHKKILGLKELRKGVDRNGRQYFQIRKQLKRLKKRW